MQSLSAPRRRANHRSQPRDPAPSKWGYRYQRLMLTPGVRGLVRIGTPILLIVAMGTSWYSHAENREMLSAKIAQAKASLQHRPEFMVASMAIKGADEQLTVDVQTILPVTFPVSSFDLDLEAMRKTVEALNAVKSARVRVGEGGALEVDITPRVPVALWRDGETLRLIDAEGHFAGVVDVRADRLDLPLIAGDAAQDHIGEALALFAAARPVAGRMRGLVRMGERRWDMVMDREQRVLLPEENPIQALDRVIALDQIQDLLERDVAVVDMRNASRPTIRMTTEAAAALRNVSQTEGNN